MSALVPWMAPYSGWAILAALALLGAGIVAFGLFADRALGRRRCPRCAYDLSHSPTATCSECGYALRRERDGFRTRPHWRPVAIGLLVASAMPAFVVQRRVSDFGWRYYTYVGPLYWLLPDVTLERDAVGDATLWIHRDRRNDAWTASGDAITLTRRGRTIWWAESWTAVGGADVTSVVEGVTFRSVPTAFDVDGDGRPECIVSTAEHHGLNRLGIYVLKIDGDRVVDLVPQRANPIAACMFDGFADLNGDGRLELIGVEPTLGNARKSTRVAAETRVVLSLRNGKYEAASDLMRCLPPFGRR